MKEQTTAACVHKDTAGLNVSWTRIPVHHRPASMVPDALHFSMITSVTARPAKRESDVALGPTASSIAVENMAYVKKPWMVLCANAKRVIKVLIVSLI